MLRFAVLFLMFITVISVERTALSNGYIKMLLNSEPSLDDWKKKVETIIKN